MPLAAPFSKPKAIIFDVAGTLVQSTFMPKVLTPYFKTYHTHYLHDEYNTDECKQMINELRVETLETGSHTRIEPPEADKRSVIESISAYVNYCIDRQVESTTMSAFRFRVWFYGVEKDHFQMPVYSDVAIQLQNWHCALGIKLIVYSNGWAVATRKFLAKTSQGDLNLLIEDVFDTDVGMMNQPQSYTAIVNKIGEKADDIIFLSKSFEEAHAAKQVGLKVALVLTHRAQVAAVAEACNRENIPVVRSFNEIVFA